MKIALIILACLFLIRLARSLRANSFIETPKITASTQLENDVELRTLAPMIQASVIVTWTQQQALNNWFRQLAGYIFGGNTNSKSVAMTAPVATSKTIAMTAPVATEKRDNQYRVSFMMPSQYTLDTLPTPNNPSVRFEQIPEQQFYVWSFSFRANEARAQAQLEKFQEALKEQWIVTTATPILNQYNDPRTMPRLRTNEWWIAVK
jgi:SOUL heme-binding protein